MIKELPILMVLALGATVVLAQPVIIDQPVNQAVIYGGNATFNVMATGVGPLTYQWQMNGTNLPNNIISTVAGGQLFDGLTGTNTILNFPTGATIDSAGNIFIADSHNNIIRKLDTNGLMTIVAGNGSASFSGDGGPATNAGLWGPFAVVFDTNHNMFISDSGNNRIRKVDTNGVITTYAGSGNVNYSGDGGQATGAGMNLPFGLALDAVGNLFFADFAHSCIRKVNTSGIISTVAGNGNYGFAGDGGSATLANLADPYGVAVDSAGNIFIADTYNYRIRKVTAATRKISTVAGTGVPGYVGDGGIATAATLGLVYGLTLDASGNVLIADSGNNCLRKISNNIISTVVGDGVPGFTGDGTSATNANLALPYGVSVDSDGNYVIADAGNNRIRMVGTNGVITTIAGRMLNDGVLATNATLNEPLGMVEDAYGNLFIADKLNNVVRKVDAAGVITTVAGNGIPAFAGDGGAAANASLNSPNALALTGSGDLLISDVNNQRIRKADANGIITTVAGNGTAGYSGDNGAATNAMLHNPVALALDAAGNLFVADQFNNRIRKVGTNGIITTVAGPSSPANVVQPVALCVDASGVLYFVQNDSYGSIRKMATNGTVSVVFYNGMPCYGLGIDSVGDLYYSDFLNSRIRERATNHVFTIAGNGVQGFSGDNGPAGAASIAFSQGVFVDSAANLYIADSGNNRIRKVAYLHYADQMSFTVANANLNSMSNLYSVIIASASGSVTSSVVSVNLQLPPIMPLFTALDGTLNLSWSAVSNFTYQLQYATNLASPDWQNLGSPITATNATVSTSDIPGVDAQRFYRVQLAQ